MGCSRLKEPIMRQKIVSVFHGHAHKGLLEGETKNVIKVYNVAKPILQKAVMPSFCWKFKKALPLDEAKPI